MTELPFFIACVALLVIYARFLAMRARHQRLQDAVFEVYYLGHWALIDPKEQVDEDRIQAVWTNLRDAAEFTPGDTSDRR